MTHLPCSLLCSGVPLGACSYVDYLFGNETEAVAFAESQSWEVSTPMSPFTSLRAFGPCIGFR